MNTLVHTFDLPDMRCGRCASSIRHALERVDPGCEVRVDLPQRRVQVGSTASRAVLGGALASAGYPPRALAA